MPPDGISYENIPQGRASKITHFVHNISNLESGQNSKEKETGPEWMILEN